MENTLYVALSRQVALRREMEIIANNMANMSTTAFKSERPVFQAYLMGTGETATVDPTDGGDVAFVQDYGILRDTSSGSLTQTGNPYDLALQGDGFFVVQTPDGDRYTRNGHFTIDPAGKIVTREGLAVLNASGQPITVPKDSNPPVIAGDGTVTVDGLQVGKLRLVEFGNLQQLRKEGDSLWSSMDGNQPQDAKATQVQQGMIEGSNVQPVIEMTRMIDVSRTYQSTQRMIEQQQQLEQTAIQKLASVQ